jgi:CheY-like chemotaxis protein
MMGATPTAREEAMSDQPLVLIVDDEPYTRDVLARFIQRMGLATCAAENNTEALALAQSQHPDLMTTDMFRPGGSGLAFIQQVRALPSFQDTPIVMISGSASAEHRAAAERLGPTVSIEKPFAEADIVAVIERVFPKQRWHTERGPKRADEQE